jgi:hypothetical protein
LFQLSSNAPLSYFDGALIHDAPDRCFP